MKYKIEILLRLPSLNEYIGACRTKAIIGASMKKRVEDDIMWFIKPLPVFKNPIKIHFIWVEENKRRDLDNVAFAKKFILDALVKAGKLKNDNRKNVVGFTDNFEDEKDFKEITGIVEETATALDTQIKSFENIQREEKQVEINKLLKELNTTDVNIENEKWLNATYKLKDIEEEIKQFVSKYNQDMELLKDEDVAIRDYYKRTLDISATLTEKKRLDILRQEEQMRAESISSKVKEIEVIEEKKVIEETVEIELKTTAILEVSVTRTEAIRLKEFLINNSIEYKLKGGI